MKAVLLIDFGSTYTKITAVDIELEEILGTASSYTTVETDINIGFNNALKLLEEKTGKLEYTKTFACSSAAGGLRMISCGLVPDLTTKAAKMASLGAGAKLVKTYSYELTEDDILEIDKLEPDIFLLTGGIDGGNTENILHNAKLLGGCKNDFPIIFAGNRNAKNPCQALLEHKKVFVAENVMPKFNELNVEPVQGLIREIFLEKITHAKGANEAQSILDSVLMPTPVAILEAMKLLAKGTKEQEGIGEILGIDLGGATTDIYSIAWGRPKLATTVMKGLPEPYAKRTVEGDIGMRYSIHGIVEASGVEKIAQLADMPEERVTEMVDFLGKNTDRIPETDEEKRLDFALAYGAIETATVRHVGTLESFYTPMGETYLQTGKDLSDTEKIVVTGGAIIHSENPEKTAKSALYGGDFPMSLRPKTADIYIDRKYILSAMGLLGEEYPNIALKIMKKELLKSGN